VEPQQAIRTGIAASAIAHLSVLMLVILFSEVHPFGSVTTELIAVDIVTPQEVAEKKPEPPPPPKAQPSDSFDLASNAAASGSAAPSVPEQAAMPAQTPATQSASRPNQQQAATRPQPPAASPSPVYTPPEPDLSIKYHVMLGLPPDLSSQPQARPGDGFDDVASKAADIASSLVTEFRRHLKTCSKLPGSIAPSDKVRIVLRVFMTTEGRLATEPVLIEASATAKGPLLMQGAISALQACQPYAMLPADRYGEWKVLDLSFTPQDFAGG
jgi:hypothetical protein